MWGCGEYDEEVWQIRCEAGVLVAQKSTKHSKVFCAFLRLLCAFCGYLPKATQSPCDVPMNSNIGNESQAFVREARNACRASSGAAAGPVPAVAASIRLLL